MAQLKVSHLQHPQWGCMPASSVCCNTLQTSVVQLKKIIVVAIVICNAYISHYVMSLRNRLL